MSATAPQSLTRPTADPVADRLDRIAEELAGIARAAEIDRRERQRWADLVHELTPVAQAAISLASDELEELSRDVTVDDATRFTRTLVRSLPQLELLLTQVRDVAAVITPDGDAEAPSVLALLRRLREERVRRGLARTLDVLAALGAPPDGRTRSQKPVTTPATTSEKD